ILLTKSINNLKTLNFFKNVKYKVRDNKLKDAKIIDIEIEEKATGEIMAGAGVGTSGGTITVGIKENNYLGKGIKLNTNATLTDDSIKGLFSVTNPNFNNSDKVVYASIESSELDKLSVFGYKTNKTGLTIGTKFEFFDDIDLGIGLNSFYEKIHTDSSASTLQKKQKGNYFDNFLKLEFDNDKRNQKFQPSEGYRAFYQTSIPLISESNTFSNVISYSKYNDIFEKNILKSSFYFKSSNSLTGDNIKLSERINIPSSRLRGFEYGKVGPKDGSDYVGGNFVSAINFSSTLPQFLENSQTTDFTIFLDMANVWGVDYNSSLDSYDEIRSSIGINLDWFSAIGPLSFSLSQPITKNNTDITESFRFNLGTTF
ncbi:BamA/TamA family outer membrane protein, partial [Candidatus Pelagibacter sp.]|nr:BamA/TamA family outer membrane protein [Candidatus Pelagibacter sp.]